MDGSGGTKPLKEMPGNLLPGVARVSLRPLEAVSEFGSPVAMDWKSFGCQCRNQRVPVGGTIGLTKRAVESEYASPNSIVC